MIRRYEDLVLSFRPVVYLPLNSPTTPGLELTGNGTVSVNGTLTYKGDGPTRGGCYANWSSANYVSVAADTALDRISTEVTLMAWVRRAANSGNHVIIERPHSSHASPFYAYNISVTNSTFNHWLSTNTNNTLNTPYVASASRWDLLMFGWHNRNTGQGTMSINGKVARDNQTGEGGDSGTYFSGLTILAANTSLFVGRHGNVTSETYDGDLAHVAVFDRYLGRGPALELAKAHRLGLVA